MNVVTILLLATAVGPAAGSSAPDLPGAGADGTPSCADLRDLAAALPPDRLKELRQEQDDRPWAQVLAGELLVLRSLAGRALAAGAESDAELSRRIAEGRRGVLLRALGEDLADVPAPEPELVQRVYRDSIDQFTLPERIVSRFLLLRLPPDAGPEREAAARARLEAIRREIVDGASFAAMARRWSEAENAANGGAVPPSPRGRLLEAYEKVAWRLRPGELSDPVRLPDGLALVLLERKLPPVQRGLDEVRPIIERKIVERRRERRLEEALDEARARWPLELDETAAADPATPVDRPLGHLDGEPLTLESLGLAHRPPRLEEKLERALEREWLVHLARARGYDRRPAVAARLRYLELEALADWQILRRVTERLGPAEEAELAGLYREHAEELSRPERRRFAVLFVPGHEGELREALATARDAAAAWREGEPPPGASRRTWGPLDRKMLGEETSAPLADAAFALAPGEVSTPLRLDREDPATGRARPEGYVVLRAEEVLPAGPPPPEGTRERLLAIRLQAAREKLEPAIREAAVGDAAASLDPEALAACALTDPTGPGGAPDPGP